MDPLHLDWTKLDDLTRYVIGNYLHLMTQQEYNAWKCILIRAKSSKPVRRERVRWAEEKLDEVQGARELLQEGAKVFLVRTRMRIMSGNASEVIVNRCPNCTAIVRTPLARQCLYCRHDWH